LSDSKAVDVVRSAVDALNVGDVDGYLARFDSACQRWVAGFSEPLDLAAVGDNLSVLASAFEGLHLDEDVLFGDEHFACARWRMHGVHAGDYLGVVPTGRSIDVETCEVYEIGEDLVSASWVYGDVLGQLIEQLGIQDGGVT
jgi:predicted ester cyclase